MLITYHFLKASEGGPTQKDAKALAVDCGAKKVTLHGSHYVGHSAMTVEATKAVHRKIENIIY